MEARAQGTPAPVAVSDAIVVVGACVWLAIAVPWIADLVAGRTSLLAQLRDRALGPIVALLPISGVGLAAGMTWFSHPLARVLVAGLGAMALVCDATLCTIWISERFPVAVFHPGYFLPTVAGPLVTAQAAQELGWTARRRCCWCSAPARG